MQIERDQNINGIQFYAVLGRPINGYDWRFARRSGSIVVLKPDANGNEYEVPWEPSSPDEQQRIDRMKLFEVASLAYEVATGSEKA